MIWQRAMSHYWHAALLLASALGSVPSARADDWPQWRGPGRDGVWREDAILERFPEGGPAIRWRASLGPGYSGPSEAQGRVFVMDRVAAGDVADPERFDPAHGALAGRERIVCFDAADGSPVWQHEYDCPYRIQYPLGPRTTPTVSGGNVYTLGAMGDVHCLAASTGEVHWRRSIVSEYGVEPPLWGFASHLLVEGGKVYCLAGGKGSAVVALDEESGGEIWRALDAEEIGYSPPMLFTVGGRQQLVVWLDVSVNGLDPETGDVLWTWPFPEEGKVVRPVVTIATPVRHVDWLFVSEYYHGSLMLRLDARRGGVTEVWRSQQDNAVSPPDLNAILTTPAIRDGHNYGVTGYGALRCLKAETGEVVWTSRQATVERPAQSVTAFLVQHEDRFFLFNDLGDLIIAELTPRGYREIDRAHLLEPTSYGRGRDVVWSHPAFAGRSVFARNDREILCASLGAVEAAARPSP